MLNEHLGYLKELTDLFRQLDIKKEGFLNH